MPRLLLALLSLLTLGLAGAQEGDPSSAEQLQSVAREWVKVRELISRERSGWDEQKATWSGLNEIRQSETGKLREFVEGAEERVERLSEAKENFETERRDLRIWRSEALDRIDKLESTLRGLANQFPPPLRESVEEPLLRLEDADPQRPLQDRARDVVLILQEYRDFSDEITIDQEVREIDGASREIEILYLGMSGAWYVDITGRYGGVGVPDADGWTWREDDSVVDDVRRAIAMRRNEEVPGFIELPFGTPNGEEEAP